MFTEQRKGGGEGVPMRRESPCRHTPLGNLGLLITYPWLEPWLFIPFLWLSSQLIHCARLWVIYGWLWNSGPSLEVPGRTPGMSRVLLSALRTIHHQCPRSLPGVVHSVGSHVFANEIIHKPCISFPAHSITWNLSGDTSCLLITPSM